MFDIRAEIPLASPDAAMYRGLAYDGCQLCLTRRCAREAVRMDPCTWESECFPTCREYTCLCWDADQCCFWAGAAHCPSTLFKLNPSFCEIDCVRIRDAEGHIGHLVVEGLSYDCCKKQLLVASTTGIFRVDTTASGTVEVCLPPWSEWCTAVFSLCPYCLRVCRPCGTHQVLQLCLEGECLRQWELPEHLTLEAAVLVACGKDCRRCRVFVLAVRNCRYPVLLECELDCSCLCSPLCPCNCLPCRPPCPDPCRSKRACADLLESVALMEASLSHILNAEGEKLQKVIACTCDPCELLEVNRSVNASLVNATHLEQVLYQKLETIKEICRRCDEDDRCREHPPTC